MTVTAEAVRRWWRAFTAWRRTRPFWGGVLTIAAAAELLALTASPLQVMLIRGLAGIGTLVLAAMLTALAIIAWTHAHLRVICGVFIVILGLASFAVSNLGGFFIGLLLALVGGSLIFAWQPAGPPDADASPPDAPAADPESAENTAPPATAGKPSPRPSGPGSAAGVDNTEASARPLRPGRSGPDESIAPLRAVLRIAAVVAVLATAFVAVPHASARSAGPAAEPDIPCPSWWPWCETEEPSSPDEPGGDDPETPGDDPEEPAEPEAECDASELPATPPRLGTETAEKVAKTLAACLALPGTGSAAERDLPTVSTIHPVLQTDVMTMTGMNSGGVVDVPTADGAQRALEFTMDELELAEMDQSAGIDGTDARLHVINKGSSAVLSGGVRLYVQRMQGLIFGVVPIVLTADTPLPPIPVPYLVITQATVDTAYTRADRVDLPDLHEPTR